MIGTQEKETWNIPKFASNLQRFDKLILKDQ